MFENAGAALAGLADHVSLAVRHGGRSKRFGVVLARLGRRFRTSYVDACRLRTYIENLVREKHGELSLFQIARIQTIARLEQSARAVELSIRENPEMPADELRQARHSICQWSRERDNLLAELLGNGPGHERVAGAVLL